MLHHRRIFLQIFFWIILLCHTDVSGHIYRQLRNSYLGKLFFFIQKCSIISLHSIHLNIDTRQCINTILRNQNCNDIKIHTTSTRNLERTRKYRELVWFLRKSLKLSELKLRDAYLILKCLLLLKPHINFVVLIIIVFRMARSIK